MTVKTSDGIRLKMGAENLETDTEEDKAFNRHPKIETWSQNRAQRGDSRRQGLQGRLWCHLWTR